MNNRDTIKSEEERTAWFVDRFRPTKYDPDDWAALAREAG